MIYSGCGGWMDEKDGGEKGKGVSCTIPVGYQLD